MGNDRTKSKMGTIGLTLKRGRSSIARRIIALRCLDQWWLFRAQLGGLGLNHSFLLNTRIGRPENPELAFKMIFESKSHALRTATAMMVVILRAAIIRMMLFGTGRILMLITTGMGRLGANLSMARERYEDAGIQSRKHASQHETYQK